MLLLLLGVADLGRAYVYKTAIVNAAREAAMYAARESNATATQVTQRACDETGLGDWGSPCASGISVTCTPCPSGGADVTVRVTYSFTLISGHLFDRIFGTDRLTVGASASFPSLSN